MRLKLMVLAVCGALAEIGARWRIRRARFVRQALRERAVAEAPK